MWKPWNTLILYSSFKPEEEKIDQRTHGCLLSCVCEHCWKQGWPYETLVYTLQYFSSPVFKTTELTQAWGCQQLCSNKLWLCTRANYCWSPREMDYFLPESAWAAAEWILCAKPFAWVLLFSTLNPETEAEQKSSNLPRAEERHRLQGERGGAGDSQDTFITWQIVLSYQHALQGKLTT